jgi:hypothetical protein
MRGARLSRLLASLTRHLQVKLVLLLLSALCWVLVHTAQDMEVEFDLPLQVDIDLPEGRTLVSDPPDKAQVLLRGKGRNLLVFALLGKGRLHVDGGRGGESIPLTSKHLELEGAVDLSVAGILPALLPLDVDRLESRRLRVRLGGRLEAAEGWVAMAPEFTPERVRVRGPRSVLDTLDFIDTEPVEITGVKRPVEEELKLVLPWPSLELEQEDQHVRMSAQVERRAERRFTGIPLQVRNLPAPLSVRPRSLSVTVVGGETALAGLERGRISAILDWHKVDQQAAEVPCRIVLPEGFQWTDPTPPRFRVVGRRPVMSPAPPDSLAEATAPTLDQP